MVEGRRNVPGLRGRQAARVGRIAGGLGKRAWGAQGLISGEVAKCHDGQGMPCGQPARLHFQLCHLPEVRPGARHLSSLCLSFLLYTNESRSPLPHLVKLQWGLRSRLV